jgi:hypothetical protein
MQHLKLNLKPGEKIISADMIYNKEGNETPSQIKFLVIKTPHKVINPHHFCSNSKFLNSKEEIEKILWDDLP